jgi:3'-5' exonuclease
MLKSLSNISLKHIIALDIETVRIVDDYFDLPEDLKVAWAYKHKKEKELPSYEELAELWQGKDSAVNAEFAKICAISFCALNGNDELVCVEIYGDNEVEILNKASKIINSKDITGNRLLGHASEFFDFPFIIKRLIINGLPVPSMLDTGNAKQWEKTNLDTFNLWKVGGSTSCSLVALCAALGVPISKGDLSGAHVDVSYYAGEYERIGRYCSHDAIAVFNIVCKLKGLPIYDFDDVEYIKR